MPTAPVSLECFKRCLLTKADFKAFVKANADPKLLIGCFVRLSTEAGYKFYQITGIQDCEAYTVDGAGSVSFKLKMNSSSIPLLPVDAPSNTADASENDLRHLQERFERQQTPFPSQLDIVMASSRVQTAIATRGAPQPPLQASVLVKVICRTKTEQTVLLAPRRATTASLFANLSAPLQRDALVLPWFLASMPSTPRAGISAGQVTALIHEVKRRVQTIAKHEDVQTFTQWAASCDSLAWQRACHVLGRGIDVQGGETPHAHQPSTTGQADETKNQSTTEESDSTAEATAAAATAAAASPTGDVEASTTSTAARAAPTAPSDDEMDVSSADEREEGEIEEISVSAAQAALLSDHGVPHQAVTVDGTTGGVTGGGGGVAVPPTQVVDVSFDAEAYGGDVPVIVVVVVQPGSTSPHPVDAGSNGSRDTADALKVDAANTTPKDDSATLHAGAGSTAHSCTTILVPVEQLQSMAVSPVLCDGATTHQWQVLPPSGSGTSTTGRRLVEPFDGRLLYDVHQQMMAVPGWRIDTLK